ncbi:Transcription factor TGA2.1 [Sesamum angolense]|uniref:Transcription factor TGA2.1 n=1 Tax=Sesamum angolense TaxID=2727404 RepID=A0AAE2BJ44_9LAMI|nr:Transcription factor TGA2.1 [Sesamum angolense]
MALMSENGTALDRENFEEFYIRWKEKQKLHLHDLITTATEPSPSSSLAGLVDRVLSHYKEYYRVESKCIKTDVLLILSAPWKTALEDAFIWVGGWRPSAAFHLLYSKSGLQLEAKLAELMKGQDMGDLSDLSSAQLSRMDKLQRITIQQEREISEEVAKRQKRVADQEMVELSRDVSEVAQMQGDQSDDSETARAVDSTLKHKEEDFQLVVQSADYLRLTTLKGVVNILSPIQAVHFN